MRILKILLSLAVICAVFLAAYTGAKLSLHRQPVPQPNLAASEQPVHEPVEASIPQNPGLPAASPPPQMLQETTARMHDMTLANVSAKSGALIRFDDGSYLAIAPHFLSRDTAISVALSAPAMAESAGFEAVGDAMIICFKPLADGLAYADAAPPQTRGAAAGLAIPNAARMQFGGQMVTFVKRVFLADGTSTDFEENPATLAQVMAADLAADHVLAFTARYRGTILVSLQRFKGHPG